MSISETAATGDRLETLYALREKLADAIDASTNGHDISALTNQMMRVLEEISELEKRQGANKKQSALDKARAAARGW